MNGMIDPVASLSQYAGGMRGISERDVGASGACMDTGGRVAYNECPSNSIFHMFDAVMNRLRQDGIPITRDSSLLLGLDLLEVSRELMVELLIRFDYCHALIKQSARAQLHNNGALFVVAICRLQNINDLEWMVLAVYIPCPSFAQVGRLTCKRQPPGLCVSGTDVRFPNER